MISRNFLSGAATDVGNGVIGIVRVFSGDIDAGSGVTGIIGIVRVFS